MIVKKEDLTKISSTTLIVSDIHKQLYSELFYEIDPSGKLRSHVMFRIFCNGELKAEATDIDFILKEFNKI